VIDLDVSSKPPRLSLQDCLPVETTTTRVLIRGSTTFLVESRVPKEMPSLFPCVTMTVCRLTMFSIGRKQAILFFSWLGIHPVDSADAAAV
jgi:hypothetical protein